VIVAGTTDAVTRGLQFHGPNTLGGYSLCRNPPYPLSGLRYEHVWHEGPAAREATAFWCTFGA
jgi:hypothetical protein